MTISISWLDRSRLSFSAASTMPSMNFCFSSISARYGRASGLLRRIAGTSYSTKNDFSPRRFGFPQLPAHPVVITASATAGRTQRMH